MTKRDTVKMCGLKVKVASDEECERAEAVICAPATVPLYLADNLTGPCADCSDPLQWRPHVPRTPPKICFRCLEIREILKQGREL